MYQWLIVEPKSTATVLNLRETYVVGALVSTLNELAGRVRTHWASSHLRRVVVAIGILIQRAGETPLGEVVRSVLFPPGAIDDEPGDGVAADGPSERRGVESGGESTGSGHPRGDE